MATYAIGDVQGCARTLKDLLVACAFDPACDRVWLAGDLVNRGPHSLEVLRWAVAHDAILTAVLGNHDLHLLGRAHGVAASRAKDTLDELLAAPDRATLIDWLRERPFLHREGGFLLVHAGLLPAWSEDEAERHAHTAQRALRGAAATDWLQRWSERRDLLWQDELSPEERTEFAVRVFCNLRGCDAQGQPMWSFAGPPLEAPTGFIPWYDHPLRAERASTVVCGHWAAQGLLLRDDLLALDTGCVWGDRLTAVRLEDRAVFSAPLRDPVDPRLLRR